MIRGTLHRGDARTWSHRRLTRASAGESHTCGEPTRPPSDSWGLTPPDPRYRSAATRRAHTPSMQRGVGRNPFIPAGFFALVRVGRDRSGRPSVQRGVGRNPFIPAGLFALVRVGRDRSGRPSVQRGVGRNPFIPAGLFALVRVGRDRSGRPFVQRGVGRSSTDPEGGRVSSRTSLLRDARRRLQPRPALMPSHAPGIPVANAYLLRQALVSTA